MAKKAQTFSLLHPRTAILYAFFGKPTLEKVFRPPYML